MLSDAMVLGRELLLAIRELITELRRLREQM
jgi:hypothetical protein